MKPDSTGPEADPSSMVQMGLDETASTFNPVTNYAASGGAVDGSGGIASGFGDAGEGKSGRGISDESSGGRFVEERIHGGDAARLSYKFQRLREKLREAIAGGELTGRLPGERQLARKFRVNAKTLSKALTDLAAEGLLHRSIGRGTFVRGPASAGPTVSEKWLLICDPDQVHWLAIGQIKASNPDVHVCVGMPDQRPSFLNAFKAAIIFGREVPDSFIRDLVVRNVAVVVAGREPSTFSTHAVLADLTHGATCVGRELMLAGHRRFLIVETRGSSQISSAMRKAAARYAPAAVIEPVYAADVESALGQGGTAIVCDSFDVAWAVRKILDELQLKIPQHISLAAVGFGPPDAHCSGYLVSPEMEAKAIMQLLRDPAAKRPTTIWLAATPVDRATIGPALAKIDADASPMGTTTGATEGAVQFSSV